MRGYTSISFIALALCAGAYSVHASTVAWENPSSGNWSDTSNWNPKHVPGPNDTAVITASGTYTVTLDTNADVGGLVLGANDGNTQTLALNGKTLTLAGPATVNLGGVIDLSSGTFDGDTNSGGAVFSGTLSQAGGDLAGVWTLTTNSVLNLTTTNALTSLIILTNYGTVVWSNTDLYGQSSPQVYNYGLWNAQSNNTFYGGSGAARQPSTTTARSVNLVARRPATPLWTATQP